MVTSAELNSNDYGGLVARDNIDWCFALPAKTVAIGDLHGDLEAFAAIARAAELIDGQGRWDGGDAHLVLTGDLVGGHKHSRLLLDMIMRLEREARDEGGRVHALLGNHDLMAVQGRFSGMKQKEMRSYTGPGGSGSLLQGTTVYARWMRSRNAFVLIGEWLFTHAGVDSWGLHTEPQAINTAVRAWVRYWQGMGPEPPADSFWTVAHEDWMLSRCLAPGPIWNRSLRVKRENGKYRHRPAHRPLEPRTLKDILRRWNASSVVVGHSPLDGGEILTCHPLYREHVVMIDTRISSPNGRLSALLIADNRSQAMYVDDRDAGRHVKIMQKRRSLYSLPMSLSTWTVPWVDN